MMQRIEKAYLDKSYIDEKVVDSIRCVKADKLMDKKSKKPTKQINFKACTMVINCTNKLFTNFLSFAEKILSTKKLEMPTKQV